MRALGVAALLPLAACSGKSAAPSPPDGALPLVSAAPPASHAPSSRPIASSTPPPKLPCAFLGPEPAHAPGVSGDVTWLDLAAGSVTTAKDPRTGRETSFAGPGRARACVDFELEAWIAPPAKGDVAFTSVIGGGESPGSEQWIMTPLGAVRYASARMEIRASVDRVAINVGVGTAYVWSEQREREKRDAGAFDPRAKDGGVGDDGWVRVEGGATVTLTAQTPGAPEAAARAAIDRCAALADAAHAIAKQFGQHDAALGDLAVRHVVARRLARAACGVARVRAESLASGDAGAGLAAAAKEGDATWRSLGD